MALTQTQLVEAMKPVQFDLHSSIDPPNLVSEPSLPSSSLLSKDKSFSSAVSSINSLLSGEKFEFGAVTSRSILPSNSLAVTHGGGGGGGGSQNWSQRRTSYHGRNHSLGTEKNYPSSKTKQIYVAKQTTNGHQQHHEEHQS